MIYNIARFLVLTIVCLGIPAMRSFQAVSVTRRPLGATLVESSHVSPRLSFNSRREDRRTTHMHLVLVDAAAWDPTTLQALFAGNKDFWIFLAGIFPFAWATVEFWRRIAFGEAFGTGSDSVIIGMDGSPADSRGRRVLGKGALITACVLFALAFGTIGIVLYSVISSDAPPDILPSVSTAAGNLVGTQQ